MRLLPVLLVLAVVAPANAADAAPLGRLFFTPERRAALVLSSDELTSVMMNRFPYAHAHLMVAPRRHTADLLALDAEAAAVLFIGTVQGIVLQAALFARAGSMQAHARRILPLLLHGFCGARR